MDKNIKIFAMVGAFATLSITIVSVIAILKNTPWASTGIIIGIICATITVIVPIVHNISLRYKRSSDDSTKLDVDIKTKDVPVPPEPSFQEKKDVIPAKYSRSNHISSFFPLSVTSSMPLEKRHNFEKMLAEIEKYLINDQIPESGGWGLSQENIFEYTSGVKQTAIDIREGGIVSTFLAIRALSKRSDISSYNAIGKNAVDYLLRRQDSKGGFGRFSKTRSGEEIKTSYRHTGLALMTLLLLDGPPQPVINGMEYLTKLTNEDISDDAAPSIAIGSILLCCFMMQNSRWGEKYLNDKHRAQIDQFRKDNSKNLINIFESESKNTKNQYRPLWSPYAGSEQMIYDSSLNTIDLITLCDEVPWETVCRALIEISRGAKMGALPYDPSSKEPDIGISLYYASLCYRPEVKKHLSLSAQGLSVLSTAEQCLHFCVNNFSTDSYWKRTYVDTVSNALLLVTKT